MLNSIKVLDCTLRDGGYYTNWDFSRSTVINYVKAMDELPIDIIEIGYRSISKEEYYGEFFYTPINTIDSIKQITNKPIALILNERELNVSLKSILSNSFLSLFFGIISPKLGCQRN